MNNVDSLIDNLCCGCTACENICPVNAIRMEKDFFGFLVPKINSDCINCGLCTKICKLYNKDFDKKHPKICLALKRKSESKRAESQSGGAFAAFSREVLKRKGIVYGVVLSNNHEAVYKRISLKRRLKAAKGSKYVQASLDKTLCQVEKDLLNNKLILFSGTPCHIDGLKSYLKFKNINTINLITCDLVCHGVPSPRIFNDYFQLVEQRYKSKIKQFNFRDKRRTDWHDHQCSWKTREKIILSTNYTKIFYSHLCLREICYKCPYASIERISDITIGDYWGIEKKHPELYDRGGVSLTLVNTDNGQKLIEWVKKSCIIGKTEIKDCLQHNLQKPTIRPNNCENFWKSYFLNGFEKTIEKFCDYKENNDYYYKKTYRKKD